MAASLPSSSAPIRRALATALLALPLAAGTAGAAPGWLAPDTLSAPGAGSGIAPRVAVAPDGDAVAVWQERSNAAGQPCRLG